MSEATTLYERAGINDLAEFYRTKFVSDEVLDHRYFKPLDRFDLRFARTMWVYDNVRRGSAVLDLGCGAGILALLKRKGVTFVGVDLSDECVAAARRNGYDETHARRADGVAICRCIIRLRRKPRRARACRRGAKGCRARRDQASACEPEGVTMHGIECTDRQRAAQL